MSIAWGPVLTALVPLALVIALSPLTIIPAVLVLQAARPRATGLAFTAGWLAGLAALTAAFVALAGLLGGLGHTPPRWAGGLRLLLGAALIGAGLYRWATRDTRTEMPRWMRSFTDMTPRRAAVTALILALLRPEVLFMCAAAGLTVGSAGLDPPATWTAAALFVVVAAATVAVPVLGFVAAGDRVDTALARLRLWLQQQHAALLAAVLVMIGVMVFYKGIYTF